MLTLNVEGGSPFWVSCPEFDVRGGGMDLQSAFGNLCDAIRMNSRFHHSKGTANEHHQLVLANPENPSAWFGEAQLKEKGIIAC